MDQWQIKKSLGQCWGTGRTICEGQEYFAALVESAGGFERRDFSQEYWNEHKPPVFCFWKSKLAGAQQKKKMFIDDGMLMAFFERLATETEPDKVNFRFVLTLILMRKRLLKYDCSELRNGQEIWRLKITGTGGDIAEVVNPHLAEEQIEQLSSQLGQILQVEDL